MYVFQFCSNFSKIDVYYCVTCVNVCVHALFV